MATESPNRPPFGRLTINHRSEAEALTKICTELNGMGQAGRDTASRIQNVGESISTFRLPDIYTYLDPVSSAMAFERDRTRALHAINLIRNILILLPLALTWFALQQATVLYQADLIRNPGDVNVPFLDLWQNGFGSPGLWLTFSHVATIDVGLYLLLITVGFFADNIVRNSRARVRKYQDLVTSAAGVLGKVALVETHSVPRDPNDVSPWVSQVQSVLTTAANLIEQVSEQMNAFQASANSLGASAAAIGASTAAIGHSAEQMQDSANRLSDETHQLTAAVGSINTSAGNMASASGQINNEIRSFTGAMGRAIGSLETVQRQSDEHTQRLVQSMSGVANDSRRSADSVARAMETFGRDIRTAGHIERRLVERMESIHRQQVGITRRLRGISGGGFLSRLFGRQIDYEDGQGYYVEPDEQSIPYGPPPNQGDRNARAWDSFGPAPTGAPPQPDLRARLRDMEPPQQQQQMPPQQPYRPPHTPPASLMPPTPAAPQGARDYQERLYQVTDQYPPAAEQQLPE